MVVHPLPSWWYHPPSLSGRYAKLFGVNVWGHVSCVGACAVGFAADHGLPRLGVAGLSCPRTRRQPDVEHPLIGESVPRGGRAARAELVKVTTTATVDSVEASHVA